MRRSSRSPYVFGVVVFTIYSIVGFLLYAGSLEKYFAMEDFFHIGWVEDGGLKGVLQSFYSSNEYGLYRPLSIHVYFYVSRLIFGLNPLGYHLVNLMFQIANAALVCLLTNLLVCNRKVALIAGVVFLVRISHYFGIFWVSGIQEVWLAFFCLASTVLFVRYTMTGKKFVLIISVGCFLLALACKESAVMLPFVLVCYRMLFQGGVRVRAWLIDLGVFFAIMIAFVMAKLLFLNMPAGRLYEVGVGLWVVRNLVIYLIWQMNLTHLAFISIRVLTDVNPYAFLQSDLVLWLILCGGGAGLLSGYLIFRNRLRTMDDTGRLVSLGILIFLISLVPALLLKHRAQQFYLYVPSIGFSMGLASILVAYCKRSLAVSLLIATIVAGFVGYHLHERIPDGRSSTMARTLIGDLNKMLSEREDVSEVYVENSDSYMYQVLWYGKAFDNFLERPVSVVFDFENPHFRAEEKVLRVFYRNGHFHRTDEPQVRRGMDPGGVD